MPQPDLVLTIDAPPPAEEPQPQPLMRFLMPAVMIIAVGGMVVMMVLKGQNVNPYMLMMPLFMGLSVLGMVAPTSTSDPDRQRRTYLRHLADIKSRSLAAATRQRRDAEWDHPAPGDLWSLVGGERMWARTSTPVEVRVGTGVLAPATPVQIGTVGPVDDYDPFCVTAFRHLIQTVSAVDAMPVTLHLDAFTWIGITGEKTGDVVRTIVAELAFAYSPSELSIRLVGDRSEFEGLKWFPHLRQPSDPEALIEVVVCHHPAADEVASITDRVQRRQRTAATTIVLDVNTDARTPIGARVCDGGLVLIARTSTELAIATINGEEIIGAPHTFTSSQFTSFGRALSRHAGPVTEEHTTQLSNDLPSLLHISPTDLHWDALWSPHRSGDSRLLTVPIGMSRPGSGTPRPVTLDLKESALGGDGPHGLCIGATGSGKSELIKSIVAALALTHSPEELNLVLVDFKGGATFLELGNLPHTAAVITNLADETLLVERMAEAITGEITRRQEMLRAAGCVNVTDYRTYRESHPTAEPLPELLIIIDEFSELLGQHPDFADLFVTVGRVGRSLGLHLLLASQRLDEGRLRGLDSHLSYRIGLKTFSAGESRTILGVPDAYHLPNQPGAGYLRTGADTLTGFQAAYVSGPVDTTPPAASPTAIEGPIRPFTLTPPPVADTVSVAPAAPVAGPSLVDLVVEGARQAAAERGMSAHQVWLPPLPQTLPIGALVGPALTAPGGPGNLSAPIGIIDRPALQRQDPFHLDLRGAGGHVALCGGPQTGKTTALRSIAVAFAATHTTEDLRIYVLDLAGTELDDVVGLPHVSGIAHRDEPERVERVLTEVCQLVDTPDGVRRHTLLLVDGYHILAEDFPDQLATIGHIAADGLASRVHLVVSTPRWSIIRPAVRDLVGTRIELHLTEPLDSVIDRRQQEHVPAQPGRGLTPDGEQMLLGLTGAEDTAYVAQLCATQPTVPALRMLPQTITRAAAAGDHRAAGILLGVGGADIAPVYWDSADTPHLIAVGASGSGKSSLLTTIAAGVGELGCEQARLVVIDPRRSLLGSLPEESLVGYAATHDAASELIAQVQVTMRGRIPGSDVTVEQLKERSWWEGPEVFVLIDDLSLLPDHLFSELAQLVPYARDIGLHVVIARSSTGASRALFTPLLHAVVDSAPATVVLSADPTDGPLFGHPCAPAIPGRAWLTHGGGRGVPIHLVVPDNPTPGRAAGEQYRPGESDV
ncbi:MAG: type VII secretion protein EccCa [Corynebacterium sp.]|nr:type VII secretion protein EccCa [Corynebacterium sp.]